MKTPRHILLERHASMEAKLNAVRHRALESAGDRRDGFRGFILSLRWHLAGLSAIWIAILILNHSAVPEGLPMASAETVAPRVFLNALLENRRQLLELTKTESSVPAALPPRRSEIRRHAEMV